MSDPLPDSGTPVQPPPAEGGPTETGGENLPPAAAPASAAPASAPPASAPADPAAPSPTATHPAPQSQGAWGQVLGLLSLTSLDDIDPEKVRNSTAFKLGALAGLLPALSLMSLAQFVAPDQMGLLDTGSKSGGSILPAVGVLLSSALVGGAVAFFWAENRLRTIFTYGVAGPTVVLSMFLSGVGNLAAKKQVQNVQEASDKKLAEETQKITAERNLHADGEILKAVNFANSFNTPAQAAAPAAANASSNPPPTPSADAHAAANPDLAAP